MKEGRGVKGDHGGGWGLYQLLKGRRNIYSRLLTANRDSLHKIYCELLEVHHQRAIDPEIVYFNYIEGIFFLSHPTLTLSSALAFRPPLYNPPFPPLP